MNIAIIGSGSWATALAKIVMHNATDINWYIRKQETIDEFIEIRRNPNHLEWAYFDVSRIHFSADINAVIEQSDLLVLAVPSPYLKQSLNDIKVDMSQKMVISAVKGVYQARFRTPRHCIYGKIAPCKVFGKASGEFNFFWVAVVGIVFVDSEGGYFKRFAFHEHRYGAVFYAGGYCFFKKSHNILGICRCCDIIIRRNITQKCIPYASTNDICFIFILLQNAQHVAYTFGDRKHYFSFLSKKGLFFNKKVI